MTCRPTGVPPHCEAVDGDLSRLAACASRGAGGLSLTDDARTVLPDQWATISKLERGEIPNPTVGTLRTYAAALGKRLA